MHVFAVILQFASGNFLGVATGAKLTVHQCLQIGKVALDRKEYTLAIPWFELTTEKIKANELNNPYISLEYVQFLLETTAIEVNK